MVSQWRKRWKRTGTSQRTSKSPPCDPDQGQYPGRQQPDQDDEVNPEPPSSVWSEDEGGERSSGHRRSADGVGGVVDMDGHEDGKSGAGVEEGEEPYE
jgi:hypothetical protein